MSPTPENPKLVEGEEESLFTKEYFQKVLDNEEGKEKGTPTPKVLSFKVKAGSKPGDNFLSLIYTAELHLSSGERRHLLIKCYPNHPARQEFNSKSNIFHKEMEVYKTWIPELRRLQKDVLSLEGDEAIRLPYAKFVYGETIDFHTLDGQTKKSSVLHPLENYIIMEDLKSTYGYRMTNRRQPLDLDHMRLVIPALAKVHALSWVYKHHVEANVLKKFPFLAAMFTDEDLAMFAGLLHMNIDQAKGFYDEASGPDNELSRVAEGFKEHSQLSAKLFSGMVSAEGMEKHFKQQPDPARFGKDAENPEEWKIICHGDCWSNNMLFRYDEVTKKPVEIMLVDLQMAGETCVVNDLQYAIYASTDATFRKQHLEKMLLLYHDSFNNFCKVLRTPTLPGFSVESLKFRFHRAKFVGFYAATMILPISLKEEDKATDMEKIDKHKDLLNSFAEVLGNGGENVILKKRLIEVAQEMVDDGVL